MNQPRSKVSDDAASPPPAAPIARHHPKTPCENCPYRVDAPRRLWHRSEFERLLAYEGDQFGGLYNCHKHVALPPDARGFCAGWLLDQKRRGIPSVRLRLQQREPSDHLANHRVADIIEPPESAFRRLKRQFDRRLTGGRLGAQPKDN